MPIQRCHKEMLYSWLKKQKEALLMPSLILAYDELTAIVRCLNSHFRTISVLRTEIVRYRTFIGRRRVVVASTILFNSELYKKK